MSDENRLTEVVPVDGLDREANYSREPKDRPMRLKDSHTPPVVSRPKARNTPLNHVATTIIRKIALKQMLLF